MILSRRNIVSGLAAITAALPFMSGPRAAKAAEPATDFIDLGRGGLCAVFEPSPRAHLGDTDVHVYLGQDGKKFVSEDWDAEFLFYTLSYYSDDDVEERLYYTHRKTHFTSSMNAGWYILTETGADLVMPGTQIGVATFDVNGMRGYTSLGAAKLAAWLLNLPSDDEWNGVA